MRQRVAVLSLLIAVTWAVAGALTLGACGGGPRELTIRTFSPSFEFRISSDPMPPVARQYVLYKVQVIDKATGQPVEGGEGRIFANDSAGARTWDSFQAAPQVGTYTARLRFVTAEQWAVGIEFRRDTMPGTTIERATDWQQQVNAPSGP